MIGEQKGGKTITTVVSEGGPLARRVEGKVSGRYRGTNPTTWYQESPSTPPFTFGARKSGRGGWSVDVTRTLITPYETFDGSIKENIEEQKWGVVYSPQPHFISVNPCHFISKTQVQMDTCYGQVQQNNY